MTDDSEIGRGICDLCQRWDFYESRTKFLNAKGIPIPSRDTRLVAKAGQEHEKLYIAEHGKSVAWIGSDPYEAVAICADCLQELATKVRMSEKEE